MLACVCLACSLPAAALAADQPLAGLFQDSAGAETGEKSENTGTGVSRMSREERAGQMLLVSPAQLCGEGNWTENIEQVVQNLETYHIGGLLFLAEDLSNRDAVKALTDAVQGIGSIPVLTAADSTGSLADGLAKPQAGDASVLGTGQLVTGAEAVWAYGLAEAPSEELAELGIVLEIVPGTGTDFAVVTNEKVKNPMDDGRPAAMSKSMITTTLKADFEGVVMTDSLTMPAATEAYGGDMAVMYALQAGADVLTLPSNPVNAYYGILSAIDEQLVTEDQINASVGKLLGIKEKLGMIK